MQSVVSLIADPGVVNLIPIPPHTFVEIDHAIFPPKSFCWFKKGCCQLQAKVLSYVHEVLVELLFCPGLPRKSVVIS